MPQETCDHCGESMPGYDIVRYGSIETGYRNLCGRCFNTEVAECGGLDFEHIQFTPVQMADSKAENHEFHFRVHLFGGGVALDAFELSDGNPAGYEFQLSATPCTQPCTRLGGSTKTLRTGDMSISRAGASFSTGKSRNCLMTIFKRWGDKPVGKLPRPYRLIVSPACLALLY
jgi:hypothetical protein